jgi:flagellar hook-associated protein 2
LKKKEVPMATSTSSVAGLSSGFDWQSMIDKLKAVEHRPIDLVTAKKTDTQTQLTEWQSANTKLLALKTAAGKIKDASEFDLFAASLTSSSTTKAEDILTALTGPTASNGTYALEVVQTAQAQKVSGKSFASQSAALGASNAGSFLVNGRAVAIEATDTLSDVRNKINALNSGTNATRVTASIVSYSATDYRLVLSSQTEGAAGMALQQAGSGNLLESLGFITATKALKNATSSGANTDAFSSSGTALYSLLGLTGPTSGTVTIKGQNLTLDLSSTLDQIASQISALTGVTAQVVGSTQNGTTAYRIAIGGTTSATDFTDANNVLQSLGILKGTSGSVNEVLLSDQANARTTAAGGGNITAADTWGSINTGGDANNVTDGDTITISGTKHDGTAVTGTYAITTTQTVQGLLTQIEGLFGVSATVTAEGKIQVTDSSSGDSRLTISLVTNNQAGAGLNLGNLTASVQGYSMELQSGRDAQLKVDGNYLTRTSNTITDVISGVTLNLNKAEEGTTVTLKVNRDTGGLINLIEDFVNKYNDVMKFIQTESTYDTEKKRGGGPLFGDGTLLSVKSDLTNNIVNQISGVSSQFSIMGLVGINLDNQGQLSVNETTLKGYLETNFNDVVNLFAANGTTTTGTLEYVTHGSKTEAGSYTVNITQAATQGTVTGTMNLAGGLAGGTTLTLAAGGGTVNVNLTNGMTLAQIVNAVNSELTKAYNREIVGNQQLYADTGKTATITNATTWASMFDAGGVSSGLQNNDTISFSGTSRSGSAVSGSYKISDINTDTVQGLLSAIETSFNNTVSASIDGSGRITLTDKTTGTSQVSLSITGPQGRNLNFGTINVAPTGADGSREGRYAVPVTASSSVDNRLMLTSNDYGSAGSFTVSANAALGLTGAAYAGLDVAGTINGETATGSGQTLTGAANNTSTAGLSVKYTGATNGVNVGTVKLTLGVAELFDRSLFNITDPLDGYVGFKQKSLQNGIDSYTTQIDQMETRLNQKMETMTNRFVVMETLLSKLQTQSTWLTSQINSLSKG